MDERRAVTGRVDFAGSLLEVPAGTGVITVPVYKTIISAVAKLGDGFMIVQIVRIEFKVS